MRKSFCYELQLISKKEKRSRNPDLLAWSWGPFAIVWISTDYEAKNWAVELWLLNLPYEMCRVPISMVKRQLVIKYVKKRKWNIVTNYLNWCLLSDVFNGVWGQSTCFCSKLSVGEIRRSGQRSISMCTNIYVTSCNYRKEPNKVLQHLIRHGTWLNKSSNHWVVLNSLQK